MTDLLKKNIAQHISLSESEPISFCNLSEQKFIKKKEFFIERRKRLQI